MLKKITALFLVMSFTQVYAVTPVQQSFSMAHEMDRAFDELNYRINVEWDQSNSAYVKTALNDFEKEITALQAQGLSSKELTQYTLGKIKDKETRDDVNTIVKAINENKMNSTEAREFAISKLNNMYSHGANWSGSRIRASRVALILGLIALIYCCTQLDGKDGRDGTNGTDGAQGPQGPAGPQGQTGSSGGCPPGYEFQLNGNNGTAICHVIDDE